MIKMGRAAVVCVDGAAQGRVFTLVIKSSPLVTKGVWPEPAGLVIGVTKLRKGNVIL